jgi:S1-C subfamily serine protease
VAVFAAALCGVLVAFQIDHYANRNKNFANEVATNGDYPFTEASYAQLPPGPPDFVSAAKKLTPSVVSVDQRVAVRDLFSDRVQVQTAGTGSGVIISADGFILTNNHVITGAYSVNVRTPQGKAYAAKVIGADPRSDLAVLKIDATGLVPAEMGDSSKLEIGQWVLAVGNPLGYSGTVCAGIVSSLKRTLPEGEESPGLLIDAIQTDAAINPGNSGGALADAQGKVVGINALIASNTGGSVGLGFAIPINRAKKIVRDIIQYGHVRYGEPGFSISERLPQEPDVHDYLQQQAGGNPPTKGLIVSQVTTNGPAALAGVKPLDIIESIDGVAMDTPISFYKYFADKRPNDKITMQVWSAGNVKTVNLQLQDIATF